MEAMKEDEPPNRLRRALLWRRARMASATGGTVVEPSSPARAAEPLPEARGAWRRPLLIAAVLPALLLTAYYWGYVCYGRDLPYRASAGAMNWGGQARTRLYDFWSPARQWEQRRQRAWLARACSGTWETEDGRRARLSLDPDGVPLPDLWGRVRSEDFPDLNHEGRFSVFDLNRAGAACASPGASAGAGSGRQPKCCAIFGNVIATFSFRDHSILVSVDSVKKSANAEATYELEFHRVAGPDAGAGASAGTGSAAGPALSLRTGEE